MVKTEKQLLKEELVCFYTKTPLREGSLGIGISIKRSPRTGLCMYVNPTMDLLSMRAFTKLKIRRALAGDKFSHWLPLYFGENEVYNLETKDYDEESGKMVTHTKTINEAERYNTHIRKTMNFMITGSTRRDCDGEQIAHFMIKLIGTHIANLMKENLHISIMAIRRLFNFFRLLFYFMDKDPAIRAKIEKDVKGFVTNPDNRTKNVCKNLLDY